MDEQGPLQVEASGAQNLAVIGHAENVVATIGVTSNLSSLPAHPPLNERDVVTSGGWDRVSIADNGVVIRYAANVHVEARIYQGPNAEAIAASLAELQRGVEADQSKHALQAYCRAIRTLCSAMPYRLPRQDAAFASLYVALTGKATAFDSSEPPVAGAASQLFSTVLSDPDKIAVITGPAGAGKSTLMRATVSAAYDDPTSIGLARPHLPLLVRARHLQHADGATIEDRLWRALEIGRELAISGLRPPAGFLSSWSTFLDAPWLLAVDALDEVAPHVQEDLLSWLDQLRQQSPGMRVVLSARTDSAVASSEWRSRARLIQLDSLTSTQRDEMAARILGDAAAAFHKRIRELGLTGTLELPLNTAMVAFLYKEGLDLPKGRVGTFARIVKVSISEAERRGLADALGSALGDQPERILEALALEMTNDAAAEQRDRVHETIADLLQRTSPGLGSDAAFSRAERVATLIGTHSGLLREGDYFEWAHSSFREYFAAKALYHEVRSNDDVMGSVVGRWRMERWRGVIVCLCGLYAGRPRLPQLMHALLANADGATLEQRVETGIFATEVLAEVGSVSPELDQQVIDLVCEDESGLWLFGTCQSLFGELRQLNALACVVGRPGLLGRFDSVLAKAEALVKGGTEEASGALAFMRWMGRTDRIEELAKSPDLPLGVLIDGLRAGGATDNFAVRLIERVTVDRFARVPTSTSLNSSIRWFNQLAEWIDRAFVEDQARALALVRDRSKSLLARLVQGFMANIDPRSFLDAQEIQKVAGYFDFQRVKPEETTNVYYFLIRSLTAAGRRTFVSDLRLPEASREQLRAIASDESWSDPRLFLSRLVNQLVAQAGALADLGRGVAHLVDGDRLGVVEQLARTGKHWTIALDALKKQPEALTRLSLEATMPPERRLAAVDLLIGSDNPSLSRRAAELKLDILDSLVSANPLIADYRLGRAEYFNRLGRHGDALSDMEAARREGADARIDWQKAVALAGLGKYDDALAAAIEGLKRSPVDHVRANLLNVKGVIHSARRDHRSAIEALNEVEALGFSGTDLRKRRCVEYVALGFIDDRVKAELEKSIAEEPNELDTLVTLAGVYDATNEAEAAVKLWSRVLEQRDDLWTRWRRAMSLLSTGDMRTFQTELESISARWPSTPECEYLKFLDQRHRGAPTQIPAEYREGADLAWRFSFAVAANDHELIASGLDEHERARDATMLRYAAIDLERWSAVLGYPHHLGYAADARDRAAHLDPGGPPALSAAPAVEPTTASAESDAAVESARLPINMLCKLSKISGFEREYERALSLLAPYGASPAAAILLLEDDDHIYVQANVPYFDKETTFPFKAVGPFKAGTRVGVFARLFRDHRLEHLLLADRRVEILFSQNPHYREFSGRFRLAPRSDSGTAA